MAGYVAPLPSLDSHYIGEGHLVCLHSTPRGDSSILLLVTVYINTFVSSARKFASQVLKGSGFSLGCMNSYVKQYRQYSSI